MTTRAGLLLGAYAMTPADRADAERFYGAAAELRIGGLEMPLPLKGHVGSTPHGLPGMCNPRGT
jgi:hypothetical protein